MDNNFKVATLTEALVAANMSESQDPYDLAAKTICQTTQVALRALPAWDPAGDLIIEEAVRGGMQALIKADLDVARGGFMTLWQLSEMAHVVGRDPSDLLLCAMRGIAAVRRLVPEEDMYRLQRAIDSGFMGAGQTLEGLLRSVSPTPAAWQTQFD